MTPTYQTVTWESDVFEANVRNFADRLTPVVGEHVSLAAEAAAREPGALRRALSRANADVPEEEYVSTAYAELLAAVWQVVFYTKHYRDRTVAEVIAILAPFFRVSPMQGAED